jgi:phospholipid/cholesterol/gamma-HCH transport system substrate-binding protein
MKRANDVIVGLTIIVAVAVLTIGLVWMQQLDIGRKGQVVVSRFQDVGNVTVGSSVVIRGVHSGRVEGIELAPNGWVEVRMMLEDHVIMPRDPVVLLNQSSLFGEWQATILERGGLPRDAEIARQIRTADLSDGKLPGATLPDIAQLTAVAGRIAGDVANVAERFDVAFDEAAAKELRNSIRNFASISGSLVDAVKTQSSNFGTLSTDVKKGVESLAGATRSLQTLAQRFDSSTSNGEVQGLMADASLAARRLREASERISQLTDALGRTQGNLHTFVASADSVMVKLNSGQGTLGLLINNASLYHKSDSLLSDIRALVNDVQKNPRRYMNVRIF